MKRRIGTVSRLGVLALAATACVATPAATPTTTPGTSPSAEPSDPASATPAVARLAATLDDGGCRLDGEPSIDTGPVEIAVNNADPKDRASFQLLRIHKNGTFDALAVHIDEEQERIDAGGDPIGIPAYASEVVGTLIAAGTQDQLAATLPAGTYAMVCADWADGGGTGSDGNHPNTGGRVLVAGPLMVDGAES